MISNEQIRVMCTELMTERDPARLKLLLDVMKGVCREYLEERSQFSATAKVSRADESRKARLSEEGKKAA